MCGICGIALSRDSTRSLDRRVIERMRDVLIHRGPDDQGIHIGERVALGHRRLSIIDLAGGHQPMSSDDASLHIVYNGEVYNHLELRANLERRGHRYRTSCDTETVLRSYQEEGRSCIEKLRGMFAFAIWDSRKSELFLARDRLGIKPLYYVHTGDGSLYFASEIKALVEAGAVRPELNVLALPDYLANHAPSGSETLFAQVRRLPPGHTLLWHNGRLKIEPYWEISFGEAADGRPGGEAELIDRFGRLFEESVRLRLMADVPLGVFLSGGLDSASIVAVMSRLVNDQIKTFSVGFAEREASEFPYARAAAKAFRTDHHEVLLSPRDFFGALPRLIWHEDEPLAHPSSVALYFVAELASQHVKVVLTGEGSDELLAGYGRYPRTIMNLTLGGIYEDLTTNGMRRAVRRILASSALSSKVVRKLRRTFLYLPLDAESIYLDNFAVFSRASQLRLLTPEMRERVRDLDPYAAQRHFLRNGRAKTALNRLLNVDIKTYLHELLMKQDQMSMAASIESRVPFLDHHLVEFVAGLPEEMKLRRYKTKYILRRCLKQALPKEIMHRRKMGFPVPVGDWLRGPYRHVLDEYVLGERVSDRGFFDRDFVRRLVEEHLVGAVDHTERLWSLINFELWQRQFLDRETGSSEMDPRVARVAE